MRILIVSHPPLSVRHGASQTALKLAASLRDLGHVAEAWTPEPLPASARWWNLWWWQRRRLESHLARAGPYDVIDVPAVSVSRRVAAAAPVVARSVQPDLRYCWVGLKAGLRRLHLEPRQQVAAVVQCLLIPSVILKGWRRARVILCLGGCELEWMQRRLPWTRPKLESYVEAPSAAEQEVFSALRRQRRPSTREGVRHLWIGRWSAHKGTGRLVRFLEHCVDRRPLDRFTLAGCGPEAARDCPPGLLDRQGIRLVESFSRRELVGLLESHDIGLFTSLVEGWGLSLNEMLESGMPVFATPAGAVRDLQPYIPNSLLAFPPLLETLPRPVAGDLAATGYYDRFSWQQIGRRYASEVLRRLCG